MAGKLKAEGFVVLLLNIHAAEGLLTACADPIDGERIAEYINEAVVWRKSCHMSIPTKFTS